MWKMIMIFLLIYCIDIFASTFTVLHKMAKQNTDIVKITLQQELKDFNLKKERASELSFLHDLYSRLDAVYNDRQQCSSAENSFFHHYGIKNSGSPMRDMGEELKSFYKVFLKKCPTTRFTSP